MKFIDIDQDAWSRAAAGGDMPADTSEPVPYRVFDLAGWQAVRDRWPTGMPVGVALANDRAVAELADDLPRIALVALDFPKWTDGRAYSQAHRLRLRHRFGAELRATGEVLVDMLPLLARNGFDAVVLRPGQSLDAARRALDFFPVHYQGDALRPQPRFARAGA